jgi:hypothetical protein
MLVLCDFVATPFTVHDSVCTWMDVITTRYGLVQHGVVSILKPNASANAAAERWPLLVVRDSLRLLCDN